MSNQYRLVGVGNAELVAGLSKLVQQSDALTAQVLAHLVELNERQLHLELGFSSLFAYCVEGLGMSEGTAGRRVTAARACRRFPEVLERVARGELHLCALCALSPHLNEQNATELFDASERKTRRQVEAMLAARFPRPDVREQIRRLPARVQGLTRFATADGKVGAIEPPSRAIDTLREAQRSAEHTATAGAEGLELTAGSGLRRAEPGSIEPGTMVEPGSTVEPGSMVESRVIDARPRPRVRELEPLSADRFGVHFTADAELRALIERARELASHRVPKGDLAGLMKLMVASFVSQEEKRRFGIGARPRRTNGKAKSSKPEPKTSGPAEWETPPGGASVPSSITEAPTRVAGSTPTERHGRYLAAHARREIHGRDGGQCSYVSPDGRRCSARGFIQFDHVEPFARHGSSDTRNLRLLCMAHNLLHARHCFGKGRIAGIIASNRRDSGRPSRDSAPRPR